MNNTIRILLYIAAAMLTVVAADIGKMAQATAHDWTVMAVQSLLAGVIAARAYIDQTPAQTGSRLQLPSSAGRVGAWLLPIALAVLCFGLSSCAGLTGAITGQPVPAVAVQRAGQPQAPVIQVAAADMASAELGAPDTIHGLYDAGQVASAARGVFTDSSK